MCTTGPVVYHIFTLVCPIDPPVVIYVPLFVLVGPMYTIVCHVCTVVCPVFCHTCTYVSRLYFAQVCRACTIVWLKVCTYVCMYESMYECMFLLTENSIHTP